MIATAVAILRKDLTIELRTRESVPAMVLFSVTVFVLFHFGLDRDTLDGDLATGVIWVTLLLAALLGVNRLYVAERDQGGFTGMRLAPIDLTALWLAKAAALFLYLVALELVALPAFDLLLLGPGLDGALPELLPILLLANLGLAAVGALVAALAIETRARDLIVPAPAPATARPGDHRRRSGHGAAARRRPVARRSGEMAGIPGSLRCGVRAGLGSGLRLPPR